MHSHETTHRHNSCTFLYFANYLTHSQVGGPVGTGPADLPGNHQCDRVLGLIGREQESPPCYWLLYTVQLKLQHQLYHNQPAIT